MRYIVVIKIRKYIPLFLVLFSFNVSLNQNESLQIFDVQLPQKTEQSSRKKRMRKSQKKDEKAVKKIRTYRDMEYQQLAQAKDAQRSQGNTQATIKYLEQLLKITTDITLLAEHLLELADALFDDKQFQKATFVYSQFCALYPGNEKQEYALYRSIIGSFACILSVDRDQTKTEETLALAEIFLQQDHFTLYKKEVEAIQKQCYEHLAASECNICSFYIQKGSLKAAEKRLSKIRSFWLPKLPELELAIIALDEQITEKKEAFEILIKKNTELAQNSKKHMAHRF